MTINMTTLKAIVKHAVIKTSDNPRWRKAVIKAAREIVAGNTPLRLPNGHYVVASRTNGGAAYEVNGACQCQAAEHGNPCWHRAAVRLMRRYEEAEDIRQRWSVRGQTFVVEVTPAGDLIIEDTVTKGCFAIENIKAAEAEERTERKAA